MKITQKKYPDKANFSFHESKLTYEISGPETGKKFSIGYSEIPNLDEESQEMNTTNKINIYVGSFLLFVAIVQDFFIGFDHFVNLIWFVLGCAALSTTLWQRNGYTVFQTNLGTIFILRDKQHDRILDMLKLKRKDYLLSVYGKINGASSFQEELSKFNWLYDQNVLSKEELDKAIYELEMLYSNCVEYQAPKIQ